MTTSEFTPQPSTAFSDTEPSGPDHNGSQEITSEMPKVNQRKPPRAATSTRNGRPRDEKPSGLGLNKQVGSGIPKLTKSHAEQIASMYTYAGMTASPFNMRLAKALATGADDCANAWVEWGNANDKLRRRILGFLEGGAATKVFMAHAPILLATVPPDFVGKMMARFGIQQQSEGDDDE